MPKLSILTKTNRWVLLIEPIFSHKFVGSSESGALGHCLRMSASNIPHVSEDPCLYEFQEIEWEDKNLLGKQRHHTQICHPQILEPP